MVVWPSLLAGRRLISDGPGDPSLHSVILIQHPLHGYVGHCCTIFFSTCYKFFSSLPSNCAFYCRSFKVLSIQYYAQWQRHPLCNSQVQFQLCGYVGHCEVSGSFYLALPTVLEYCFHYSRSLWFVFSFLHRSTNCLIAIPFDVQRQIFQSSSHLSTS